MVVCFVVSIIFCLQPGTRGEKEEKGWGKEKSGRKEKRWKGKYLVFYFLLVNRGLPTRSEKQFSLVHGQKAHILILSVLF